MQSNRFSKPLVASLFLTFASCPVLGAETEYSLKVDAVAPLSEYVSSFIVEASAERDGWSVFVAPELIARKYEVTSAGWLSWYGSLPDELLREVSAHGVGVWAGVGLRPWREDFLRALRTGFGVRGRWYSARIASHKDVLLGPSIFDSSYSVVSKRKEVTSSVGISANIGWMYFPHHGSEFLRTIMVEPYARLGLRSDWIETTAFEGGDRIPGTSSSHEWTRDIRLGVFVGKVF